MGTVHITQHVDAAPARVHAAWTSAEELASWWWPHLPDTTYVVDATPGGAYEIRCDAVGIGVRGQFVEVDPPHGIAFTWTWLDDGDPGPEERVEVWFGDAAGGTEVTVTHHLDEETETGDDIATGWRDVLGRLAERVASTDPASH